MATVLCVGAEQTLIATRSLILRKAGHLVVTAMGEPELLAACTQHRFDVAVIGQCVSREQKRRFFSFIRQYCPTTKILELYPPGARTLADADG